MTSSETSRAGARYVDSEHEGTRISVYIEVMSGAESMERALWRAGSSVSSSAFCRERARLGDFPIRVEVAFSHVHRRE